MSAVEERPPVSLPAWPVAQPGWDVVGPLGEERPPTVAEPLASAGWTVDEVLAGHRSYGFLPAPVPEPLAGPPEDPPPVVVEEPVEVEPVDPEPDPDPNWVDPPVIVTGGSTQFELVAPVVVHRTSVVRRVAAAIQLLVLIVLAAVALATAVAVTVATLAFALRRAVGA